MKPVLLLEEGESEDIISTKLADYAGSPCVVRQNGNIFLVTIERLTSNHVPAPVDVIFPGLPKDIEKTEKAYSFSCEKKGCKFTTTDYRAAGGHKGKHTKEQQRRELLAGKKKHGKRNRTSR